MDTTLEKIINEGNEERERFRYSKAISKYQIALERLSSDDSPDNYRLRARIMNWIGDCLLLMGKWDEAEEIYRQILEFSASGKMFPEDDETVLAWIGKGKAFYFKGSYQDSTTSLQIALQLAKRMMKEREKASCYYFLGATYSKMGKNEEGNVMLSKSLEILEGDSKKVDDPVLLASVYNEIALNHLRDGNLEGAKIKLTKSIELTEKFPSLARAEAYRFMGVVLSRTDGFSSAIVNYLEALKIYRELGYSLGEAKVYNSLGQLCLALIKPEYALVFLEKGIQICLRFKYDTEIATIYGKLGDVFMLMEDYEKAIDYYRKDLEISGKSESYRTQAYIHHNIGKCYIYTGQTRDGMAYLKEGLKLFQQVMDELNVAKVCKDICHAYIEMGNLDEAEKIGKEALEIFSKFNLLQEEAYIKVLLGSIERHRTHWEAAEKLFNESISFLEKDDSALYLLSEAYYEKALLFVAQKKKDNALEFFEKALNITWKGKKVASGSIITTTISPRGGFWNTNSAVRLTISCREISSLTRLLNTITRASPA